MKTIFHRAQHGDLITEQSSCYGEAGEGIYAMVPNKAMEAYYRSSGEGLFELKLKENYWVLDLTQGQPLSDLLSFGRQYLERLANEIPGYVKPSLTSKTIQRFGSIIESFVRKNYSEAAGYMVPHVGPSLPTGIQIVIKNLDAFDQKMISSPKVSNDYGV